MKIILGCSLLIREKQPPTPNIFAYVQITINIWRRAKLHKNLKILCNIDKLKPTPPSNACGIALKVIRDPYHCKQTA